ncbi:MAG: DUF2723 domain-containing protein [bacterium TMED144]|nr:MAG: DUF2723 domain-containing protein [bacterium TMED144]
MINSSYISWNKIGAVISLLASFLVYLATMADTVPYWDSGEFIASSYILGVPHPPGSPLYLLLGRIFSMLPFNSDIAFRVNLISPIVSALAVMFLYLSTVKLINRFRGKIKTQLDAIIVFSSSLIGSLTFAFTDSHWFNAVEAEVYGFSTFFTAIVVWLILLWSEKADEDGNERYILIIAYMIGLATGVHLLNLLALPFIALIIFFRNFDFSYKGFFVTVILTGIVYFVINSGIINGVPKLVRSIGLYPFVFVVFLLLGLMIASIIYKKYQVSYILTATVLVLVGYSSYASIFVRSQQQPAINENDPSNVTRAIAYMEREQYGQMFQLPRRFRGLPPKHEVVGRPANNGEYSSRQERKYKTYRMDKQWDYFLSYQIKKMYWRYFLWQFAGRGASTDDYVTSYGANSNQDGVYWFQFGLPLAFLLGLWGLFYHFQRDKESAFSVLSLFLMTGLAIIIFVNQNDPQPRERDYSYVGSFFAFSIWIGIALSSIGDYVRKFFQGKLNSKYAVVATFIFLLMAMPGMMLKANYHEHDRSDNRIAWDYSYNILQSCEPNAILFTNGDNDTFPLWYLQEVEGIRRDVTIANLSLLNTEWYIRQIKKLRPERIKKLDGENNEGMFISMVDEEIKAVASGLREWKSSNVKVPAPLTKQNSDGFIQWKVDPTYAGVALMVKDLMILRIISDSQWKYPIYFAVTVPGSNRLGLEEFLEMEGLVYRLRPYKTNARNPINEERMWANLMSGYGSEIWEKDIEAKEWKSLEGEIWSKDYNPGYLFRNLGREDVYYFPSTNIRLLQNLRSAYMQLAVFHFMKFKENENGDKQKLEYHREKALAVMNKMQDNIPEKTIRFDSKDLHYQVARIFGELGKIDELLRIMDILIQRDDLMIRDRVDYGQVYMTQLDSVNLGKDIFEKLYLEFKDIESGKRLASQQEIGEWQESFTQIISSLVYAYKQLDMIDDAKGVLNDWLAKNPDDPVAKKLLEDLN